jgi:hypothetical protein
LARGMRCFGIMTIRESGHCAESRKWFTHFSLRSMTALHVSRCAAFQLTESERRVATPSIQQFQLGEGARGQRLLERGQKYGRKVNDPLFAGALDLFIKEEQQHSRYLSAFMESQGIPLVQWHWVDSVFRELRGLAGLELPLTVLVTAEIIAVPYYRALRGATGSFCSARFPSCGMGTTECLRQRATITAVSGTRPLPSSLNSTLCGRLW